MWSVPQSPDTVRGLQERVARALPAAHEEQFGGWLLRSSGSPSWWQGSVLPHADASGDELLQLILAAEAFSARLGMVTRFQITPGACPEELDAALSARGYRRDAPMSLQIAPTAQVAAPVRRAGPSIRLDGRPTTPWFDAWYAVHGHHGDPLVEWDTFGRVTEPSAYAVAVEEDAIIGVGRAVADGDWAGVFGMATIPSARGRGAAGGILTALAAWAAGLGADGMYLQVDRDNEPAKRLYARAGFVELCCYHYRSEAPGPVTDITSE